MAFQPIRRILPQAMQQAGIDSQVSAARVVDEAQKAIVRLWGEERASFVEPVSFKDGSLNAIVRSGSAAHALRTMQSQWVNEINRTLGQQRVKEIRIRREGF
jgi:hypothetical protein